MDPLSFIGNSSPEMLEELYQKYLANPENVEQGWRTFFEGFEFAKANYGDKANVVPEHVDKEFKVINLINGYRIRGHLFTKTNPVRDRRKYFPTLAVETFGLTENDLNTVFQAGAEIKIGPSTLKTIIAHLEQTYCQSIGAEYKYIRHNDVTDWLEKKMESEKILQFLTSKKRNAF